MIDLDGLKQTNDRFGHEQGDRLIQRSARAWSDALRQSDFLARLGGDEFVLLLPDCTAAVAEEIARRMIDAVPFGKTCSVGVATWDGNEASHELVHRADQAMYTVKAAAAAAAVVVAVAALASRPPRRRHSSARLRRLAGRLRCNRRSCRCAWRRGRGFSEQPGSAPVQGARVVELTNR